MAIQNLLTSAGTFGIRGRQLHVVRGHSVRRTTDTHADQLVVNELGFAMYQQFQKTLQMTRNKKIIFFDYCLLFILIAPFFHQVFFFFLHE